MITLEVRAQQQEFVERMAVKKTHHELLHTTFNWNDFSRKQLRKDDSQGDNSTRSHTTRKEQTSENRKEFIALRRVPVVLKNGNREMTVNALLDDASTQTYINNDVAAELGLHGKFQKATVNVLNGQVETFVTMPFELKSLDGKVTHNVSAFTTEKVTETWK